MATASYRPPENGWRTFLIVWGTQSLSVFGSALTGFAITIWLTTSLYPDPAQKPQLAWALSAWNLSFAIPVVFGAPLAGAFADRHDRKRTMIAMDVLSGLLSLITLALVALGRLNVGGLVALGAAGALVTAFHNAAFDTSTSMLVPQAKLPRANAMMQTIFSLSGVLAPSVAATLIALPTLARDADLPSFLAALGRIPDGALLAIGLDAVTFFFASLALVFLYIPSPVRSDLVSGTGARKSLWADVREGVVYIWHRRSFLWLLGTFAVANLVSGARVVEPLLVKFQLAPDWASRGMSFEAAMALVGTVSGIGGVAGGFIMSAWGGLKTRRVYGVLVPLILSGLATMAYGASRHLALTAGMAGVFVALIPFMNSHSQAIWQTQTPHELQGRVFSVRRLIAQFTWPAAAFVMGVLASRFDPGRVVVVLGAVLVVWCVLGLFNPQLRRVEDREWIEAQAMRRAGLAPVE